MTMMIRQSTQQQTLQEREALTKPQGSLASTVSDDHDDDDSSLSDDSVDSNHHVDDDSSAMVRDISMVYSTDSEEGPREDNENPRRRINIDDNSKAALSPKKALACLEELNAVLGMSPLDDQSQPDHHIPTMRIPRSSPHPPALKQRNSSNGNQDNADDRRSSPALKRSVSFSNLSIREYNLALSQNPSCSYGPPVELDWQYQRQCVVDVDDYEQRRSPRKSRRDMLLSPILRCRLLRQRYSKDEVRHAMKEVAKIKHQRKMTDYWLPLSLLQEMWVDLTTPTSQPETNAEETPVSSKKRASRSRRRRPGRLDKTEVLSSMMQMP